MNTYIYFALSLIGGAWIVGFWFRFIEMLDKFQWYVIPSIATSLILWVALMMYLDTKKIGYPKNKGK